MCLLHDLSDCRVDFDADTVLKLLNNDDCDQAEKNIYAEMAGRWRKIV